LSEEKQPLSRLMSGFVFLLAKPEFYSHLASWRMVIRTPAHSTGFTTAAIGVVVILEGSGKVIEKVWTKDRVLFYDCLG
jgi:hypothetical protein